MNLFELYAFLKQIRGTSKGVTAMEYGVIAAAVIVAIATTLATIGTKLKNSFANVSASLTS